MGNLPLKVDHPQQIPEYPHPTPRRNHPQKGGSYAAPQSGGNSRRGDSLCVSRTAELIGAAKAELIGVSWPELIGVSSI